MKYSSGHGMKRGRCTAASPRLLLLLLTSTVAFCPLSFGDQPEQRHYLKLTVPRVAVDIPDAGLAFDVGSRARFFQETAPHFIGLADMPEGEQRLFAVPRRSGGAKTAWVTPEKEMFFGFRTRTCKGRLILIAPEKLPVLEISGTDYLVHVERFGGKAVIRVPKSLAGVEFVSEVIESPSARETPAAPAPEPTASPARKQAAPTEAEAPKSAAPLPASPQKITGQTVDQRPQLRVMLDVEEEPEVRPAPVERDKPQPVAEEPAGTEAAVMPDIEAAPLQEDPAGDILDLAEELVEQTLPAADTAWPVAYEDLAEESAAEEEAESFIVETPVPGVEAEPSTSAGEGGAGISWVAVVAVAEFILLVLLGALIFRRRAQEKAVRHKAAQASEGGDATDEAAGAAPVMTLTSKGYKDEVSLCGALESMSLVSVLEILLAKKESGLLSVSLPGQEAVGSMTIHNGQVIDACFGEQRGPDAFNGLMGLKAGVFIFVRCDTDQYERTIEESTVSLVMKAGLPP